MPTGKAPAKPASPDSAPTAAAALDSLSLSNTYPCSFCTEVCTTEGWLAYHMKKVHNQQLKTEVAASAREKPQSRIRPGDAVKLQSLVHCPNCGKGTMVYYTTQWMPATLKCEGCNRIMPFASWRLVYFSTLPTREQNEKIEAEIVAQLKGG